MCSKETPHVHVNNPNIEDKDSLLPKGFQWGQGWELFCASCFSSVVGFHILVSPFSVLENRLENTAVP